MFRKIEINSYRGLNNIQLDNLELINVLVGDNNSGKTSVLEAIQLFADRDVLREMISVARKRDTPLNPLGRNRLQPFDAFLYSFPINQEQNKKISVDAYSDVYGHCRIAVQGRIDKDNFYGNELSEAEERRYHTICDEYGMIRVVEGEYLFKEKERYEGKYYFRETQLRPETEYRENNKGVSDKVKSNIMYISPMDIYTGKVLSASLYKGMLVEEKERLLELMRLFDDRIVGIETAVQNDRPVTMIELGEIGLMPISLFGDGIKKVLTLASAVIKTRDGIVLIDEFETGIHKRALRYVAEWMIAVAKRYNVQFFLTTHSSDAIAALVEAQGKSENVISAYRLEHYKNKFYVKNFTGNDLSILNNSQGLDIL